MIWRKFYLSSTTTDSKCDLQARKTWILYTKPSLNGKMERRRWERCFLWSSWRDNKWVENGNIIGMGMMMVMGWCGGSKSREILPLRWLLLLLLTLPISQVEDDTKKLTRAKSRVVFGFCPFSSSFYLEARHIYLESWFWVGKSRVKLFCLNDGFGLMVKMSCCILCVCAQGRHFLSHAIIMMITI